MSLMDEKVIVRNAKSVCERDGYDQIVYYEKDGSITFTRLYTGLELINTSKDDIICVINSMWNRGIHTAYVSYNPNDIALSIRKMDVTFN